MAPPTFLLARATPERLEVHGFLGCALWVAGVSFNCTKPHEGELFIPTAGRAERRWVHFAAMRRSAVLLVMLFALLWQTVAMARPGSTMNALADLEHAALHWQEEGHHHHEDGSYHLDDSVASAQHVLSDHVSATVALVVATSHHFPPMGSAAPDGLHVKAVPDPALDGPLRPPRSRS